MASLTEEFFNQYQQAMNDKRVDTLTSYHSLPSVFVLNDIKRVASTSEDIDEVNQGFLQALSQKEVSHCEALVNQAIRLSDSVLFASVRWQFKDVGNRLLITSYCSYTMQVVDEQTLKIIVAVIDDQENALTGLMTKES
ncbi:hypothetical protein OE749_13015 [Aestuariibacter sp. AA17]|uniref:Uncharacterized protein n=1 Tax=Fluctibacter corallii TaxID=2984329 RepID=A0ABT3AAA8_9ALTE|nr:hypothetical protein [Aestuariibacter sp. AA17]MCV2885614.1 hypothetical protein [Aestuariibacter sp. AA17]